MQATRSQAVTEEVVFWNDLARRREPSEAAVGDLDAPGVPDGAEDRLLDVPPDSTDLKVMVAAESADGGRGDSAVHEDQLEPVADILRG